MWVVLTLFGAVDAGQLSSRWYQSLAVPGKPAYEASQRTLAALGVGVRAPNVVVFRSSGDATRSRAIERAMQRAAATMPGARTSSYFSTRSPLYVSRDRHTTFEEVYPPGPGGLDKKSGARQLPAARSRIAPSPDDDAEPKRPPIRAQLRCAVRRVAITAAERNEVFCVASFRIVPGRQKPAFGVGALSRRVVVP